MRTQARSEAALGMIEESSIQFIRAPSGTAGTFSFLLKDSHHCRVDYWTQDPNGVPSSGAPKSINCPSDASTLAVKIPIDSIKVGIPLTFRIAVWPKTLTALNNFTLEYREDQENKNLANVQTEYLVIARYVGPRNSNEIYTYQFPTSMSVKEIKAQLAEKYYQGEVPICNTKSLNPEPLFPRNRSLDDVRNRPLHGLSSLNTDGFGRATATIHPFFSNRLMQFYESVERKQNWLWNFQWETKSYTLESFPPGYLANLTLVEGSNNIVLKNRLLGNALPTVDSSNKTLRLIPSILYPTEIARYDLSIKSADANKLVLHCQFSIDQETLTIPETFYQKIPAGEYLATLVFETNQLAYKNGEAFPPWLITAQDWIHFKINKKL